MNDTLRILYVEDNEVDSELLRMCFSRYKFTKPIVIDIAETIEEAKELFNVNMHCAVLIDWNLPDGEGIEVVKFIRNINKALPLFLLSGAITQQHQIQAEQACSSGYLEKDYNKSFAHYIYTFL